MPEVQLSEYLTRELENKEIGDKIRGTILYEIVGKSQDGVKIRIDGLMLKEKKQIE